MSLSVWRLRIAVFFLTCLTADLIYISDSITTISMRSSGQGFRCAEITADGCLGLI